MHTIVVLAGGLGTRVEHLSGGKLPKALLPINGVPFIDLKLAELRLWGADDVVMLVGHHAREIHDHVGNGYRYGLRVRWVTDGPVLLGTGGAVVSALPLLGDVFWVTYGDNLLEVPVIQIEEALERAPQADAVMTVLNNEDRWGVSNVAVSHGIVADYRKGSTAGQFGWIDYGMNLFRRRAFERFTLDGPLDLSSVINGATRRGTVLAFPVTRRFFDIGTEEGIKETESFLRGAG